MPHRSLFTRSIYDIATDSQLNKIYEGISNSSQLVCAKRGLTYDAGYNCDAFDSALTCLHQRTEIAITRKDHNMIDLSLTPEIKRGRLARPLYPWASCF